MSHISDYTTVAFQQAPGEDIAGQLIDYVPESWTSTEAKLGGGVFRLLMTALAGALVVVRTAIDAARAELRVRTADGAFLDLLARDYFGTGIVALLRDAGENDDNYRTRILAELLRERGTVRGVAKAVETVTGAPPDIFEPFNVRSTGAWIDNFNGALPLQDFAFAWGEANVVGGFITQFNGPHTGASPDVAVGVMGDLGEIYTFFVTVTQNPRGATLNAIRTIIERTRPVGTRGILNLTGA